MNFKAHIVTMPGNDIVGMHVQFKAANWPAAQIAVDKLIEQLGFSKAQVQTVITPMGRDDMSRAELDQIAAQDWKARYAELRAELDEQKAAQVAAATI